MTAPTPIPPKQDDVKWLALTLRQGLLLIVREIERKYEVGPERRDKDEESGVSDQIKPKDISSDVVDAAINAFHAPLKGLGFRCEEWIEEQHMKAAIAAAINAMRAEDATCDKDGTEGSMSDDDKTIDITTATGIRGLDRPKGQLGELAAPGVAAGMERVVRAVNEITEQVGQDMRGIVRIDDYRRRKRGR